MEMLIIVFISLVIAQKASSQSSYCSITSSHTMCRSSGVSSFCGEYYYRGLTRAEKQEALETHNRLRSRVAVGSTNQPSAADMMELQWDDELAAVAQRHADQCQLGHDCNECRRVSRFKVGQNIFRGRDSRYKGPEWRYIIEDWFSEIDIFPGGADIVRYSLTPGTGHYTQLVWGETSLVGCGLIIHKSSAVDQLYTRYYVCNYGRGGNRLGKKMYQQGRPCSFCPGSSTCSFSYEGLCSNSYQTGLNIDTRPTNNFVIQSKIRTTNNIISSSSNVPKNNLSQSSKSRPTNNLISDIRKKSSPISTLSYRREPRLTDTRFSPRLGEVSLRRVARPRVDRRTQYTPCTNIWCQLATFFQ